MAVWEWGGEGVRREEGWCTSRVTTLSQWRKIWIARRSTSGKGGRNDRTTAHSRTWVRRTTSLLSLSLLSLLLGEESIGVEITGVMGVWRAFGMSIMLPPSAYNGKPTQYHPLLQFVAYLKGENSLIGFILPPLRTELKKYPL